MPKDFSIYLLIFQFISIPTLIEKFDFAQNANLNLKY